MRGMCDRVLRGNARREQLFCVQATAAQLDYPFDLCTDGAGGYIFAGTHGGRRREEVFCVWHAGRGLQSPAHNNCSLLGPADMFNHVLRRVSATGVISLVAGSPGQAGYAGDGGEATAPGVRLFLPAAVSPDGAGGVYLAEWGSNSVRRVFGNGTIAGVAGDTSTNYGFAGDGGEQKKHSWWSPEPFRGSMPPCQAPRHERC